MFQDGSVEAVVAKPENPQAILPFCKGVHSRAADYTLTDSDKVDLVLPFNHEIATKCHYFITGSQ